MLLQALLLKAAAVPLEQVEGVLAEALDMLKQDATVLQVVSMAADLLKKSGPTERSVPGATLEVCGQDLLYT